ncbi:MAG: hypothetical protein KAR00_01930 [Candidatus Pacebacteria bacterium]|nr:hypothetical protein [Candidatus Paceibacterota bacterium]
MLKLLVKDTTAANPVLPVSWCISEDLKERFRKEETILAYLLIVAIKTPPDFICYGWEIKEVERVLVPLSQGLAYIRFSQPGEYLLYASVIVPYDYHNGGRHLKTHFLSSDGRRNEKYGKSVFKTKISKDDILQGSFLLDIPGKIVDYTIEKVMVAEKFFAPEPPQWEKNWVLCFPRNLGIPIRNQCHYRAWRIIAYSIQPILFLIWYTTIGLFVAMYLSLGFWRKVNIRRALLSGNPGEYFSYDDFLDHNFFLRSKEHRRRSSFWFLFSPAYLIFGAIALGTILPTEKPFYLSLSPVVITGLILFIFSLGILFLVGLVDGVKKVWGWIRIRNLMALKSPKKASEKEKRQEALRLERLRLEREKEERQKQEKTQHMINGLEETVLCENRTTPLTPNDLPLNLRTIHLRAQSIKAKVCKQFAKE